MNLIQTALEEVALEGLDGITLETLWYRLQQEPLSIAVDPALKEFIWKGLLKSSDIEFFKLRQPRLNEPEKKAKSKQRTKNVLFSYPIKVVTDKQQQIFGSCPEYSSRKHISGDVRKAKKSCEEAAAEYGNTLVIVASQELRSKCLTDMCVPIADFHNYIQPVHYAMLERIGRARCAGAFVTGKNGLAQLFNMKPKDLHYVLQNVLTDQLGLIQRQIVHEITHPDSSATSVAFLSRFYKHVCFGGVAVAGANNIAFQRITSFLEGQKDHRAPLVHIQKLCSEVGVRYKHWIKRFPTHFTTYSIEVSRKEFEKLKVEAKTFKEGRTNVPTTDKGSSSSSSGEEDPLVEPILVDAQLQAEGDESVPSSSDKLTRRNKKLTCSVRVMELVNPGSTVLGSASKLPQSAIRKIRSVPDFSNQGSPMAVKTSESAVDLKVKNEVAEDKEVEEAEEDKLTEAFEDAIDSCRHYHPLHSMAYEIMQSVRASGSEGMSIRDITTKHIITDKTLERPLKGMVDSGRLKVVNVLTGKAKCRRYVCPHAETVLQMQLERFRQLSGGVSLDADLAAEEESTSSDRHVRRLSMILEFLQEHKVTLTTVPMCKAIAVKELDEGYPHKIDKRHVVKLLEFLRTKGLVGIFQTTLKREDQPVTVYCEKNLSFEDAIVQQAVAEARMTHVAVHPKSDRYAVVSEKRRSHKAKKRKGSDAENSSNVESDSESSSPTSKDQKAAVNYKKTKKLSDLMTYHPKAGVQYGVQSKMLRLQIFHQYLYYLVYGYRGSGPPFREKFTPKCHLSAGLHTATDEVAVEETADRTEWEKRDIFYTLPEESKTETDPMEVTKPSMENEPPVYLNEVSWQRYIPPLEPIYDFHNQPLPEGWFMLNDVILAMPLSIFVLIVPLCYRIEGLEEWLADPVRRHTLLADLPATLRKMLTFANKHILTLRHHCALLSVLNLVANGPCKFLSNSRSRVFNCFYLRRNATVWDTSTSERQFLFVTQPMERYKRYEYTFDNIDSVELFWHHMTAVCISTRLGFRLCLTDEERLPLKRFDRRTKEETLFRISTGTFDEVNRWIADGSFPSTLDGDAEIKPGAAGTHPLLFIHRAACWGWNRTPLNRWICDLWIERKALFADEVVSRCENITSAWRSQVHSRLKLTQKFFGGSRCPVGGRLRVTRKKAEDSNRPIDKPADISELTSPAAIAKEAAKVPVKRKRVRPETSGFTVRSRNQFSKREMYMLVLIKAVNHVLSPTTKLCVSPVIFKEIMDKYCEEARDKPLSCLHRMANRLLSHRRQMATMKDLVDMMAMNSEIMELKTSLTTITTTLDEEIKKNVFITFFEKVWSIFSKDTIHSLPDTLEELQRSYRMELFRKPNYFVNLNLDPKEVGQIRRAVLHNVVYANYSLLKKDGQFGLQLRTIYDQFSDEDLDATVKGLVKRGILLGEVKRRWNPGEKSTAGERGDIVFSHFFRHFFYHKFYRQMDRNGVDLILSLTTPITDPHGDRDGLLEWIELNFNSTPAKLTVVASFHLNDQVDLRVKQPADLIPVEQLCDGEADGSTVEVGDTKPSAANMAYIKYRMDRILSRLRADRLRATDATAETESSAIGSKKVTASMWPVYGRFTQEPPKSDEITPYLFDANEPQRKKVVEDLDALRNVGWHKKKRKHKTKRMVNYSSAFMADNRSELNRPFADLCQPKLCQSAINWIIRYSSRADRITASWFNDVVDLGEEANVAADLVEKEFWADCPEGSLTRVQQIYAVVCGAKSLGVTQKDIETQIGGFDDEEWSLLTSDGLLETVGVAEFRYVSFRHAIPWLVQSVKVNKDSRAAAHELDQEESDTSIAPKKRKVADTGESVAAESTTVASRALPSTSSFRLGNPVVFAPKPWIKPDGTVNRSMLRWLAEGIFLHIVANPGVTDVALGEKFCQALQNCLTLEVTEFLIQLKCVKKRLSNKYTRPLLFGPKIVEKNLVSYEATSDGLLRFHMAFEKTPPPDFAVSSTVNEERKKE